MTKDPSLDAAYALEGKEEVRALYQAWADTYDDTFVAAQGYQLSKFVTEAFVRLGGTGPVLDVGAGTGIGGEALAAQGIGPVDALDLSPDMLKVAQSRGVYRTLIEADITEPLSIGPYRGVISAGTFTFGHVGPAGLINLLDAAAPGALFVISVNDGHFREAGFDAALTNAGSDIQMIAIETVPIYDDRADDEHRADQARLLQFRRL